MIQAFTGKFVKDFVTDKKFRHNQEKSTQQKQAVNKLNRRSFISKIKDISWRTQARKVIQERYNHYVSTGNVRKADIYRRKLEE